MKDVLARNACKGIVLVTQDIGAGSSGKGSLNAWLADNYPFHFATNNWMPNAGHYWEANDGTRILNQHVCSAFVNPDTELYINAGAAINMEILFREIEVIESHGFSITDRLTIHPHANVITEDDIMDERRVIKSGSTFKGCGAALARKTLRVPGQRLAKDYDELSCYIKDRTYEINNAIAKGANVLIEGSQGVDLDINHAEYPYITSRQTIPQQLVADAGIPFQAVSNVIMNVRTNPIRINNQSAADPNETCYTGNYWDAKEISWIEVAKQAGFDSFTQFTEEYGFALMTSVTKKLRRVFEFPVERLRVTNSIVGGDIPGTNVIYSLNFINFVDRNVANVRTFQDLCTPRVLDWLDNNLFRVILPSKLKFVRTGPKHSDIVVIDDEFEKLYI